MQKKPSKYNLITILGPTATGKTTFASQLALKLKGEIISADSRQVYTKMDIGTGKDIDDYTIENTKIPFHLIDIKEPGYQYNVYEYQSDFLNAYKEIQERHNQAILCGGTGMYIEAVLKGYKLINVPVDEDLKEKLNKKTLEELAIILKEYRPVHNISDTENKKRAIRAIEIETYYAKHPEIDFSFPKFNYFILGIKFDRNSVRRRITERLKQRLDEGMVDEVKQLLDSGLKPEQLIYYGLEYKYLTEYIIGDISFDFMFEKLNIAIHQFSKRQMTWFRRMEKNGMKIHWLDGYMPTEEKIERAMILMNK
jgi:tRNA dimethylallyltransferase